MTKVVSQFLDRLISYLAAGVPTIVIFAWVSGLYGFLFGTLAYLVSIAILGELFFRFVR